MKRKNPLKSSLILIVLALVIVLLSVFVLKPYQDKQSQKEKQTTLLYPDLDKEKVVDIKIENSQGAFQLRRKAENNQEWYVTVEGKNFDADKNSIEGIISSIRAAKRENTVAGEAKIFGLQPAKFKLIINDGLPNKPSELDLGEDTPVDYLVYGKWTDKPEVFTTTRSLRFGLDKALKDFRVKKVFDTPVAKVEKIEMQTLATPKAPSQKIALEKRDGNWISASTKASFRLDTPQVEKMLKAFQEVSVINFKSENPADRAALGFAKPIAKLILSYKDKGDTLKTETWALSRSKGEDIKKADAKKDEAKKEDTKKEETTEKYFLANLDRDSTYEVAETFKDNFIKDVPQFRSRVVTNINEPDIQDVVITDTRTTVELSRKGKEWKVLVSNPPAPVRRNPKTPPEPENQTLKGKDLEIEEALKAISHLQVEEFLDPVNLWPLGLKTPSRMVEIRGKKNGKDNELLATLVFGKKLKDGQWVVRAEGMDSPVSTQIQLDEILPLKADKFGESAVESPAPGATTAPAAETAQPSSVKGKKVKLEPTVQTTKEIKKLPAPITKPGKKYSAVMTLDNGKEIEIAFDAEKAPYTVSNFLHLARNHFYDNVKFHRVIPDFVAQGGDPTGTGRGGPGYQFDDEKNDLKHETGVISMANAGANTNGSQFFLVLKPQSHLNGKHTVFGKIVRGVDVMEAIKVDDSMKKVEVFEESL